MIVPFGFPVVPDVNRQYAAFSGVAAARNALEAGVASFRIERWSTTKGVLATSDAVA
jgi:hypothetical protein